MGAGLPANTGTAGAIHRGAGFAGKPAPTKDAGESNGRFGSKAVIHDRPLLTLNPGCFEESEPFIACD